MNNPILKKINKIEEILLVLMFIAMVLVIFFQVIMRYVFSNSLSWSEELGKFLFVWISWIGISIGQVKGEHIKITLLVDKLPEKMQHLMNILSDLTVIWICLVTAYYSTTLIVSQNGVNYAGIKISMSFGYLSVFIGCILMIFRCIITIIEHFKKFKEAK